VSVLTRFGTGQLPRGEAVLQAGDSLHVMTPEDHAVVVRRVATSAPEGVTR
jgi:hypothetical protein